MPSAVKARSIIEPVRKLCGLCRCGGPQPETAVEVGEGDGIVPSGWYCLLGADALRQADAFHRFHLQQ